MGTFKHCGRLRAARLVGRDLSRFYVSLNEPQKAVNFLVDLLRGYDDEKWSVLKAEIHVELARVYRSIGDKEKLVKSLTQIATYKSLPLEKRRNIFKDLFQVAEDSDSPRLLLAAGIFSVQKFEVQKGVLHCGSIVQAQMDIENCFPEPVTCKSFLVSMKLIQPLPKEIEKKNSKDKLTTAASGALETETLPCGRNFQLFVTPLHMKEQKYFKQDNSLSSVAVVCHTSHKLLGRKDSHGSALNEAAVAKNDFSCSFSTKDITLAPGMNQVDLTAQVVTEGTYSLNQVLVVCKNLEFIDNLTLHSPFLTFTRTFPTVFIQRPEEDLLAGIPQQIQLVITAGSTPMEEFSLRLYAARGLTFLQKDSNQSLREVDLTFPGLSPSQTITNVLSVMADLSLVKEGTGVEHKITVTCPWQAKPSDLPLHFCVPFIVAQKLHTANIRKFVHIHVQGLTKGKRSFEVQGPSLQLSDINFKTPALSNVELHFLNGLTNVTKISQEQTSNFLWELTGVPNNGVVPTLKVEFKMHYRLSGEEHWQQFYQNFEITDYQTLYTVRSRVEPVKGNEFCRAGSLCHMTLTIESTLLSNSSAALMYEVLADQAMWAVCGRTAGVVSIDGTNHHTVTLDVMPLIGGFLPLPTVRLSKYIPAEQKSKSILSPTLPRLEPFSPGQVYNWSKAQQVHVLAVANAVDTSLS